MRRAIWLLSKKPSWVFLLCAFIIPGCAPASSPSAPPENYKGPIAEGPILQAGDYWVYEQGNGQKAKVGAGTTLLSNVSFPLWVGKTWSYQSGALLMGQAQTSQAFRKPVVIECTAVEFKRVGVSAGTFEAFECQCQCSVDDAFMNPDCGRWTIWYAPQVKNIIKVKTESTATSLELIEYKVSDRAKDEKKKAEEKPRKAEEKKIAGEAPRTESPAKVIRTAPENGSANVSASLKEIAIIFDQPMSESWNLSCSPFFHPNASEGRRCNEGGTHWRDDRTFVVLLTTGLKPNQRYSFTVNPSVGLEKFQLERSFRGLGQSKPVQSQRFFFTTGS